LRSDVLSGAAEKEDLKAKTKDRDGPQAMVNAGPRERGDDRARGLHRASSTIEASDRVDFSHGSQKRPADL
jgi:hypothetical protein